MNAADWEKLRAQVQEWHDRAALPGSRLTATEALHDVLRLMENIAADREGAA